MMILSQNLYLLLSLLLKIEFARFGVIRIFKKKLGMFKKIINTF